MFWTIFLIIAIAIVLFFGPALLEFLGVIPVSTGIFDVDKWAEIMKSFVETVAIVIAGYWAYIRFIKGREETREDYPYPKVQHRIESFDLDKELVYLGLFVIMTNEGKRRIDLWGWKIYIRQVSPLSEFHNDLLSKLEADRQADAIITGNVPELFIDSRQRLALETLGERELEKLRGIIQILEPGQTKEFQFDFIIPKSAKAIEAISFGEFEYDKKKDAPSSWEHATVHIFEK